MIRDSKYEASDVVPGPGPNTRHPLSVFPSLHRVQRDQFPGFISTMRVLRLPAAHPAALRFLRLAVPRLHSLLSLLDGRVHRRGLELVTRYSGRDIAEETTGSPKFLGNHDCPFAHVPIRRRQDCLHQTITVAAAWPLVIEGQRLPRKVFRRSIAWLSDSLSTLRSASYPAPRKTRFQLLVRLYWTGFLEIGIEKGPTRGPESALKRDPP